MSLLSAALRSASSQSLLTAELSQPQQNSLSSPVSNLLAHSSCSLSESLGGFDAQDDSVHSINTADRAMHEAPQEGLFHSDEDLAVGLGIGMTASVQEADNAHRSVSSPFAAKPPHHPAPADSSYYGSMAIPQRQPSGGAPYGAPMARSCPKPILMPRRGSRQNSFTQDHDDLGVFVPPHEMVATSLMDPSNVAESLNRKGSAALRVRTGVLRRTGFYEGHTETLRANGSSFKA